MAMTVEISQEDFGTLCICALRYCHGRQTYMPKLVQDIVTSHLVFLSDRDLRTISEDERFQGDMNLWGSECDKADWDRFYINLNCFRQMKRSG